MSEMIERVARSISLSKRNRWESLNEASRLSYLGAARAAITAMRESTDEMDGAAGSVHIETQEGHRTFADMCEASKIWAEMIDTALRD